MKTAFIGFNQGQYGDLFISLTACRVLKRTFPDCFLIYSVNRKYSDCIEILKLSEDIDDFAIWEGYDDYPLDSDKQYLKYILGYLRDAGFEKFHQFNPMQEHTILDWPNYWHQTEEACVMYKLPRPTDSEMDFKLRKPNLEQEETITICTGRRKEKDGLINTKALTIEIIESVKNFAEKNNLTLIQIGADEEEGIDGVEKFKGSYSESVLKVLKSKLLVSCDTGMIWVSSAFSHPTVGLYDLSYYKFAKSCGNWTPKNKNQKTFYADLMKNIDLQELEESLTNIYNIVK